MQTTSNNSDNDHDEPRHDLKKYAHRTIESYTDKKYPSNPEIINNAHVTEAQYYEDYKRSIADPEGFWGEVAEKELNWFQKWTNVLEDKRDSGKIEYKWFKDGKLNITYNCLDRHVENGLGEKIAYHYTNEERKDQTITYSELLKKVNRLANGLKSLGIKKGDTVTVYMPLTLELITTMLACARIGAIHSVVYGGFSAPALKGRIEDAESKVVITASFTKRRGKEINLKAVVDEAITGLNFIQKVIVFRRNEDQLKENEVDFNELLENQSEELEAEVMDSEDPLFILYTSGSTGKPKGVVHTTGGYNLFTHYTTKLTFDIHNNDIFWCTADCGWITGHSYVVYGPLSNGVTSVIYEGAPDYPDAGIWWSLIEKYKVSKFYTAPTAIRMFMKFGEEIPKKYDLSSLKIIGSVGEPINTEAWEWYYNNIGNSKCPIVDTWWQTETGGHMITTLPALTQKPSRAGLPFFGVDADVVNSEGESIEPNTQGLLVIKKPWPSALRTCWKNQERFEQYWTEVKNYYLSGDIATKDEEGYITILGRHDDVIKVSGHRLGSAEIESCLDSNEAVAECAVIGLPDEVRGECIKAFVILKAGGEPTDELIQELKSQVSKDISKLAVPQEIKFVDKLPKTRSGKIMRRVLRAQELGQDLGDTSTLEV